MGGLLCKIFRFILNIFEEVVRVVASAVKSIGTATVDVLSELADAVGNAAAGLFGGNGLLGLLIAGGVFWMLMGSNDEDNEKRGDLDETTQKVRGAHNVRRDSI